MQSPNVPGSDDIGMPDAGVSESLARERAARLDDLRYALSFTIPSDRMAPIAGRATITFTLRDAAAPLTLDFAPDAIRSEEHTSELQSLV